MGSLPLLILVYNSLYHLFAAIKKIWSKSWC